jgi:predicted metal-dependent HD superfamily phosphohydrolase
VLLTKDHARARADAERVLADADLYILAEEPARYARYAGAIRAEYAHVDDAAFTEGRLAFLRGVERAIAERGRLYHVLHPMHEAQARANLAGERARLEAARAEAGGGA